VESLSDRSLGWTAWRESGQSFFEKAGHTGSGGFTALLQVGLDARSTIVVLMNAEDGQYALGSATTTGRALRSFVRGVRPLPLTDSVVQVPVSVTALSADSSGATLMFEPLEHGVSMVRGEGQSALDAVLSHDVVQRAAAARWNSLSSDVVSAALGATAATAPKVAAAAEQLRARLGGERSAGVRRSQVLGTVAEWVLPSAGVVTFVRLGPTASAKVIRLHWASDSTLKGIGGSVYPSPYVARVFRTAGGFRLLSLGHGVFSPSLGGDPARALQLVGAFATSKR
jgi:hypothetical protein